MAGLSMYSPFYNITTDIEMMMGRFALVVSALVLAGHMSVQDGRLITPGTLPTDDLQSGVVVASALLIGALSVFPALAPGSLVEQMQMATAS